MPLDYHGVFDHRIVSVAGGTITPGSIVVGASVLIATYLFASLLARWLRRLLRARGIAPGAEFAFAKIVRYVIIALGALAAFNAMGLELGALLAASAVLAVGIGFGLQNIAQNFISGVILLIEQPVRRGDFVRVGETLGTVEDIGLRATHVITRDEVTIIVPNSLLVAASVINHSRPTTNLRIRITVGVAYGSDTELVKKTLLAVAAAEPNVLNEPGAEVRFEAFGDSQLEFALLCWIAHAKEDLRVSSALRFSIDRAFRDANIKIPFPQREVHSRAS